MWLALAVPAVGTARAELSIESVQWQAAHPVKGRPQRFKDIGELPAAPPKLGAKLRAMLRLKNRGPKRVEGILLRYSLTARLGPLKGGEEGIWSVPFLIEERRVPKVGANQFFDVPLEPSALLELYLRKTVRAGFWPDELKLQVMLEPHRGAVETISPMESILPVRRLP